MAMPVRPRTQVKSGNCNALSDSSFRKMTSIKARTANVDLRKERPATLSIRQGGWVVP
jgi:hypothetical protein